MNKNLFLFLAVSLFAVSCSSDDDSTPDTVAVGTGYAPLTTGSYWVYSVSGSTQSGSDSLYIAHDTLINAKTYKKFKTKDAPFGFYSSALNNNGVRKDGDKLLVTGSTTVSLSEAVPFSIGVTDLVIFKESAQNDEQLGNVAGTITQNYNGLPIIIDYTLITTAKPDVASLTVNNQSYTNVKTVQTEIFVKLSTTLGGVTVPVVNNQKIVTSTQYFAEDIGVVKTVTDFSYTISQLLATNFNIPVSSQQHQEEILLRYNVE